MTDRIPELLVKQIDGLAAQLAAVTKERDELREAAEKALAGVDPFQAKTVEAFEAHRCVQEILRAALSRQPEGK